MMKKMIMSLRANLLNTVFFFTHPPPTHSSSPPYRSYGGSGSQAGTPAASFGHTPGGAAVSYGTAAAPVASFRSTSAGMATTAPAVGFRKIAATPAIDADGYAVDGTQGTSGPRRVDTRPGTEGGHAGTGNHSGEGTMVPVGDALLPLLRLAAAYMLYITLLRRRKTVE